MKTVWLVWYYVDADFPFPARLILDGIYANQEDAEKQYDCLQEDSRILELRMEEEQIK